MIFKEYLGRGRYPKYTEAMNLGRHGCSARHTDLHTPLSGPKQLLDFKLNHQMWAAKEGVWYQLKWVSMMSHTLEELRA